MLMPNGYCRHCRPHYSTSMIHCPARNGRRVLFIPLSTIAVISARRLVLWKLADRKVIADLRYDGNIFLCGLPLGGHVMRYTAPVRPSVPIVELCQCRRRKDSIRTRVVTCDIAKHFYFFQKKHSLFKRFTFSIHKAAQTV